jgi:hypothetical protein
VSGAGRSKGRRSAQARPAAARRSPFAALVVALSLLVQVIAVPCHQARAAPGFASDPAVIAADLKSSFGDAAAFCVQVDDKGAPLAPAGPCDDQCPLCRFSAQATTLFAPAPALPERLAGAAPVLGAAHELGAVPAPVTSRNRARAPPLAV